MITAILLATHQRDSGRDLCPPHPHGLPDTTAGAHALRGIVDRLIVVVRPEAFVQATRERQQGVEVLGCPHTHEGVAAQLAYTIRVTGGAAGWIVAATGPAALEPPVIDAMAQQLRRGALLVVPRLRTHRHHPLGFGRAFGPQLSALTHDSGLIALLRRARRLVRRVPHEPVIPAHTGVAVPTSRWRARAQPAPLAHPARE